MIDRRQLLESGVALSAVQLVGGTLLTAEGAYALSAPLMPERVVIDSRFGEAAATGKAADNAGLSVTVVTGDMSRLWYDDLDLRWRHGPMTIAGVTSPEGLFVLGTLANDRGMRVVYRGLHTVDADGREYHRLRGPGDVLSRLAGAAGADSPWGEPLCAALSSCRAGGRPVETLVLRTRSGVHGPRPSGPGELVSWLIAPRGTATAVAVS